MKIIVVNSSGNVGKSVICREILQPRIPNSKIVEIESYNSSSSMFNLNTIKYDGSEEFSTFYNFILSPANVIFDIGASEIGNFFVNAQEFTGVLDMFDLFIVPTRNSSKIMEDTIKTINLLENQGVDTSKIKVVFNEVDRKVEKEFAPLLDYKFKFDFEFDTSLKLKKTCFLKDLDLLKTTILDVYHPEEKYYRELLLREKEPKEKMKLLKKDLINMGAAEKIKEFDNLFTKITGVEVDSLSSFSQAKKSIDKKKPVQKTKEPVQEDTEISEDDEEL